MSLLLTKKQIVKEVEKNLVTLSCPQPHPYVQSVYWTPELASMVLENCNDKNRHCTQKTVEKMATDMVNNNFVFTHQGIAFNVNGDLLDGQTRLYSIVKSGKSLSILTMFNLPSESSILTKDGKFKKTATPMMTQDMMDHGRKRTFADTLTFEQHNNGEPATPARNKQIAAITNCLVGVVCSAKSIPDPQLREVYEIYKNDIDAILNTIPKKNVAPIYIKPIILAAFAFAHKIYPKEVKAFIPNYANGAQLSDGDIRSLMRRGIQDVLRSRSKASSSVLFSRLTLGAIIAFVHGDKVSKIKLTDDEFRDRLRGLSDEHVQKVKNIVFALDKNS